MSTVELAYMVAVCTERFVWGRGNYFSATALTLILGYTLLLLLLLGGLFSYYFIAYYTVIDYPYV